MKTIDLDLARRISLPDALCLGNDVVLVDLRQRDRYDSTVRSPVLRLSLSEVVFHARSISQDVPLIYYCDCGKQETSARAVLLVQKYAGRTSAAFVGTPEDWIRLLRHAGQPLAEVN